MNDITLEQFAVENGLALKTNVFHGAVGTELRKEVGNTLVCIGYIQEAEEMEVYVRHLSRNHELINDKLWFFGSLFRFFGYSTDAKYRCVARVKKADFTCAEFIALARKEFSAM